MENVLGRLLQILLTLPAILLSLSVHELCHGYAAHLLGDPTPKAYGRLSMNPLKHIDPFGFIALLLFRVGWAKPVIVDSRYFRNPKRDMAITALAGPLSNFVLAFLFSFLTVFLDRIGTLLSLTSPLKTTPFEVLCLIVYFMVPINLGLSVFNLIPIPPLDGSKILFSFLPKRAYGFILKYERYGMLILIVLINLPFYDSVFMFLWRGVYTLLATLVGYIIF